jgi:CRISPR system Cascade subunit CasE
MSWLSDVRFQASDAAGYRQLAGLLENPYLQHQQLWTLFKHPPGTIRPFLFHHRVADEKPGQTSFMLVSEQQPLAPDPRWTVRSKAYPPTFSAGRTLAFELRINPSVRSKNQQGKSQRFDPVALALLKLPKGERAAERQRYVHQELTPWLAARGATYGFELDIERTVVTRYEPLEFAGGRSGHQVRLSVADFRGVLRVADPVRFAQSAAEGIGHARGFGCGLLLLRQWRASSDADEDE